MLNRLAFLFALLAMPLWLGGCVGVDFSPDGKQLVMLGGKQIEILDLDSGKRTELPASDDCIMPTWSPDGQYIAFIQTTDRRELRLYDTRTGRTRALARDIAGPLAWREDGRRLAAVQQEDGEPKRLLQLNVPDGGVTQKIVLGVAEISPMMVWLPGTDNVAFLGTMKAGSGSGDVYAVEYGEVNQLSTTGDVIGLSLEKDGTRLVWVRKSRNPRYILFSLYAYDLAKRTVTRLPFPEKVAAINPNPRTGPVSVDFAVRSPNGRWIAFVAREEGSTKSSAQPTVCYVVSSDGRNAYAALRRQKEAILWAVWSRDSERLAVLAHDEAGSALVTMSANGANRRVIQHVKAK